MKSKKVLSFLGLLLVGSVARAAPKDIAYCSVGERNVNLKIVPNPDSGSLLQLEGALGLGGVRVTATIAPGYGMFFYNLQIQKGSLVLARATSWVPDTLGDKNDTSFGVFSALTLSTQANGTAIRCDFRIAPALEALSESRPN